MNIIKTVGDLRKALSAYDENLPLTFAMHGASGVQKALTLNNDTQISQTMNGDFKPQNVSVILLDAAN